MFSIFEWKKSEAVYVGVVLVVLLGISWVQLLTGEMKTRDVQRKDDGGIVGRALTAYYDDHKQFPLAREGKIVACGDRSDRVCDWGGGPLQDEEGAVYLKKLPRDPWWDTGRTYVYEVNPDRKNFKVYTAIENTRDPGIRRLTIGCGNGVQCNWYASN